LVKIHLKVNKMDNFQKGQIVTYIPLNQSVKVVHNSTLAGQQRGTDAVTIRLKNGDLRTVPVAEQDDYLTRNPPVPIVRPRKQVTTSK